MPISKRLADIAKEVADDLQARVPALKREETEAEAHLRVIRLALHAADLASKRLASFEPTVGGKDQCPRCWVRDEIHSALRTVSGGTETEDFFQCTVCQLEFSIPE